MMSQLSAWPKVIGTAVALLGLGAALASAGGWMIQISGGASGPDLTRALFTVLAVLFISLVYPLYIGLNWARQTLIVIAGCICVATVLLACSRIVRESRFSGAPPTHEMRREAALLTLMAIGTELWRVSPSAFALLVLLHPDVVRAFRSKEHK